MAPYPLCIVMQRLSFRFLVSIVALSGVPTGHLRAEMRVSPSLVVLSGPEATQQLLVTELTTIGQTTDVTRKARYEIEPPAIATIDARGCLHTLSDGQGELIVRHAAMVAHIPLRVENVAHPEALSFAEDIVPLLSKAGCNLGSCHGKAQGQNGFRLSVFGFEPRDDYDAMVKESRGRRIFLAAPDESLILRKATSRMPHGGGLRIERESRQYHLLRRWIADGAPWNDGKSHPIDLKIEPQQLVLKAGGEQQLRVDVVRDDGRRCCVTPESQFGTNASPVANVDDAGLIRAMGNPGEAAILVRYLGEVAICRVTVPQSAPPSRRPPENNFIDSLVWDQLERLRIEPSEMASDAEFMRRACFDVIGTLPTAAEARCFIEQSDHEKRARLIDELLSRPEYADFWATRWSDILRVDRDKLTPQGAVAVTRWLAGSLRKIDRTTSLYVTYLPCAATWRTRGPLPCTRFSIRRNYSVGPLANYSLAFASNVRSVIIIPSSAGVRAIILLLPGFFPERPRKLWRGAARS